MGAILNRKAFVGSLALLSSCLSMPKDQQREHLLAPPSLETSASNGVESGFFTEGSWPEEAWWKIFQNSQLDALIEKALVQNPSIQAIEKRIDLARERAKVARSALFPWLSFDADETWQLLSKNGLYRQFNPKIPLNVNLIDLTLSFSYEFDFWSKYRNLFRAALGREKAEEAEAAQVKLITTTAVGQAYFGLKTSLVKRGLYRKLVEVRAALFELQKLLYEKALLSKLPPLLGEEYLQEAEKKLFEAEEEVEEGKHLINVLIGIGPDEPLDVDEELLPLAKSISIPNQLSVDLLARRPDLMAQIWRVEALAHDVGAAKADFFPNVNLIGFAGLQSVLFRKLFKADSKTWGLEPAIHLPIFTAGEIRANLNAKIAAFEEAVYEYNQLLLRSAQEVADMLVLVQSIFQQKESQSIIVENSAARYELTELRQQMGLDNQLESLRFRDELILKKVDDADLLFGQYLTTIKLIKALGGGYQSEFIPLKKEDE